MKCFYNEKANIVKRFVTVIYLLTFVMIVRWQITAMFVAHYWSSCQKLCNTILIMHTFLKANGGLMYSVIKTAGSSNSNPLFPIVFI